MKKVLALVASTMMLIVGGLFVSCSDETQDVYVTNMVENKYYGYFSGTSGTSGIRIDSTRLGEISWSSGGNTNGEHYWLEVPYSSSSYPYSTTEVEIYKVGSKYYDEYGNELTFISGSPESDTFTIAAIESYIATFTNLRFTRAK